MVGRSRAGCCARPPDCVATVRSTTSSPRSSPRATERCRWAVLRDVAHAADADPSTLARAAVPVIRRLVEQGFLLPVVDEAESL